MKNKTKLGLAAIGAGVLSSASYYQNKHIEGTHMDIYHEQLPISFEGFRILLVSDLHSTKFGKLQHRLLRLARVMQPDVVFMSGDLIDRVRSTKENLQPVKDFIEETKKNSTHLFCAWKS